MKPCRLNVFLLCLVSLTLIGCQTDPGEEILIPRNPDGTVDWDEAERIAREIWEEKNPPAPTPEPGEPDVPEEGEFPAGVKWLHPDVSGWPITSRLESVQVTANRITLNYDKAKVWPARQEAGATVNANPWIIAEIDGKWYAGTWEWMRYGQTTKNRVARGDHVKRPPMSGSWEPQSGDRVGFMASGLIRGRTRNVSERTNLVWITWP